MLRNASKVHRSAEKSLRGTAIVQVGPPFSEVHIPSSYVYTHAAMQARVCPHGERPQPRAREVHRANVRRGASVDRHPSRPTVRRRSPYRRWKGGESTCVGVFILCLAHESQLRDTSIERDFEVRVSWYTLSCKSRRVDRGGACLRVAVHSNRPFPVSLFLCSYECELPCVTTEFEKSFHRQKNTEPQRQNLSSITI